MQKPINYFSPSARMSFEGVARLRTLSGKMGPPASQAGWRQSLRLPCELLQSLLDSANRLGYFGRMFDLVKPQISTAADKLTHLRRFL
jgi:hypothetical protein